MDALIQTFVDEYKQRVYEDQENNFNDNAAADAGTTMLYPANYSGYNVHKIAIRKNVCELTLGFRRYRSRLGFDDSVPAGNPGIVSIQ